ncbi:PREDICTED: uncharacterized protein DDB_G0287625-like isoform X2 [Wasmannia auropunctata]|uniref:uncharacterized protein DDB_G0287625-like isoform X2 n=1 Tax=Wasmannia auropunctata TaxID=64793 RepID=UPI0005EEBDCA|nr:PREDICTED: uncharacterized protein DDB_G0287625-like isoform X2 [Wasmannia auropunctata]
MTFLRTNKTTKKSTIQLLSQINANYAIACLYSEFAGKRKTKEKYYYQIMTSKTRKARDRPAKKRITGRISHSDTSSQIRSSRCKRANTLYQRQSCDSISIPQLVYELLTIDKYNHETKRFPSSKRRFGTHCQKTQNSHERQRLSYETVDHRDDSESTQMSECTLDSKPTSIDSLTEATDAANSSAPTSSANSSVSNVSVEPITLANSLNSAKALFRKRSLVQLINSYIKAGVEEGKRQAKKYIRKALSFGVRSGYLIPTDRQGNILRVCPTLDTQSWSWRRSDTESRQRRRIARRGGKTPRLTTIADRKAMRRGIPQDKSFRNMDDRRMASRSRHKKQSTLNPATSLSTRENKPKKSPGKSLRERNKLKAFARKNNKINSAVNNNKREQQQKMDDNGNIKKPVKRQRTSFSSKCALNDREPVEKSYKNVSGKDCDQHKSNEDNYRAERQKSMSSQEDRSRMEKRKTEENINDNKTESKNSSDDDNDKRSEKGSMEHELQYD